MDIFDQIESGAAPKRDIFDEVAPKRSTLLGGENAKIQSAPGFLTNLSQAFTAPFHQEREPIAADQPRPGMFGRAVESAGAVGKGVLGLLNAPFETIAPTVTKYAGENLPIEPRTAEAIGNAAGVVAQGSILPWRSRTPLTPARNIEDLIAAPRPGLPAPPERLALPPAAQPRLNPPEMVTQVTPEGVASQAPKRTIIDLVDEVKRDVKAQVIDEIFQELKTGRPQAPKQAAPLSIEAPRAQAVASPIDEIKGLVDQKTGNFTRGGDYVNGLLKKASNDEVLDFLKWTKQPEQSPYVNRFGGDYAAQELRNRGVNVDSSQWQFDNLKAPRAPLSIEDLRGQLAPEARATVAPTPAAPPMFEQTQAGKQGVIPGAEARTVPTAPLRPKRAQTEAPLDLEQPALRAQEPELPTAASPTKSDYASGKVPIPEKFQNTPERNAQVAANAPQWKRKRGPQGEIGDAVERQITNITETPAPLEFKGKEYQGAVKEGKKIRLKDNPDKVISKPDDILLVDEKIPFDVPDKAASEAHAVAADKFADEYPRNKASEEANYYYNRIEDDLKRRKMLHDRDAVLSEAKNFEMPDGRTYADVINEGIDIPTGHEVFNKQNPLPGERKMGDMFSKEPPGGFTEADRVPQPEKFVSSPFRKQLIEEANAAQSAYERAGGGLSAANVKRTAKQKSQLANRAPVNDPVTNLGARAAQARQRLVDYDAGKLKEPPLPGERKVGDILAGEKGFLGIGRDKAPEVFGPPIEPPEVRGGIQPPKFDFSKWNDKAALSLSRETLERNIADVAPAADAAKVDKFIVQPVRQNETSRINYNNALRTETRGAVVEKLGIKAGSKEDALTQAYGEGRLPLAELKTLTPNWQKVVSASDYFRGKYDTLLDTVNAARAKFGYEPIPKRADYFRHFQDINNIIKNFGVILRMEDLPTEISGLTEGFKPGKPFTTAELQRKGGSYTMSAIRGFDNYIDSISKQIFHIDSVQRARGLEKYIREAAGAENAKLPNLVANLHEYGNLLAGKKATFDRAFESLFGRKFYAAVNVLRGRTSANMVGGNVSSALTNFIPFTQAAATTEKGSLAKGMLQATLAPFEKDPAAIDGIASSFLRRRYPEGPISPTIGEKVKTGANFLFDAVDRFTARSVVGGKYYEGINNGLSPKAAMQAADTYAGKVITDRSLGQLPNLFNIKTLGPVTQFQTEINNMYSFITKDVAALSGSKAKTVKALSEFVLYSYLFNSGFQYATGRRPTIDPIHFLITLAGDGDIKQKLGTLNEDIVSNLPFTGGISGGRLPISAGLPDVAGMIKGEKGVGSELSKPAFFLAPPFGGLQAKKTIEGIGAFNAGQVRSKSGEKKLFDIEQSPENLVRSVLFGKYASPQAREYFDSGQLTPKQKMLKQLGLKDMGKDRDEKRKEMLNKLGLDR